MSVKLTRYRLSVADYHKMAEAGILREDERVELIRGEILAMSPIGSQHAAAVGKLTDLLHDLLGRRFSIRIQNPINIGDTSEPEPDLAICIRSEDYYASRHPFGNELLLVIEVADSTLEYDLTVKKSLYAEAGIPEYWVVDVNEKQMHRFTNPDKGGYLMSDTLTAKDEVVVVGEGAVSLKNILI